MLYEWWIQDGICVSNVVVSGARLEDENMLTKQSNYFKYFKDLTVSSTNLYTHGFDRNIVVHICIHVQNESVS